MLKNGKKMRKDLVVLRESSTFAPANGNECVSSFFCAKLKG